MSEQTVQILIRLLLRSSLIRIYTVCHSIYIFLRHYFIVKLNCFILRTTTVVSLGVPIFRVFTVDFCQFFWLSVPGCVAQSVGHLTRKSGVLGSIPGLATYFRFSFGFFKKGSCQLLAKVCARSTG